MAVLRVTDQLGCHVVMIKAPNEHQQSLHVEVCGLPVDRGATRMVAPAVPWSRWAP